MICAVFSARFLRSILKIQRPEEARRFLRLDQYWCPEVAEPLIKRVDELVALKPKQALGLAEIALELTKRMRNPPRELQAHAYCALATALRANGRLEDASCNFRKAEELEKGCPPSLKAMISRQKSILLVEQGDLNLALKTAQQAVELDRSTGAFPGRSLIAEGMIRGIQQDIQGSCSCFMEVLQGDDPSSDDFLFAMKNLAMSFMRRPLLATEVVDARKSLRKVQDRIRGIRETPVRYDIWWIEALLHAVMEEYRVSINHFIQAREGFLRLELIPDFARVTIDFIAVLVKKGDIERARTAIERTAKQISEFPEHARYAEAFRLALDQPIEEAAEFIRKRLSTNTALVPVAAE